MSTQTVIEMVILFVSTGRGRLIDEDTVIAASKELEAAWKQIKHMRQTLISDQKIIVWFLEEVGNSLLSGDWKKPMSICDNVELIYKRWKTLVPSKTLEPFMVTPSYSKPRHPMPKLNFRQYQQIRGKHVITRPKDPGPSEHAEETTDKYLKMNEEGDHYMEKLRGEFYWKTYHNPKDLVRKSTELDESSSINDVIEEFRKLFQHEWRTAFESCQSAYKNDHIARFLCDVVQNIYNVLWKTSLAKKSMQKQREDAAESMKMLQRLDRGLVVSHKQTANEKDQRDHSIPLDYVKLNFFEAHLRHSLMKYKINNSVCVAFVELFTAKCIEICWYMCIKDPPIYLDFDLENENDSGGLFKPFTSPGGKHTLRRTHVVVWPALRLNPGGIILDNGWTMNF